jgi:hypothetical protein
MLQAPLQDGLADSFHDERVLASLFQRYFHHLKFPSHQIVTPALQAGTDSAFSRLRRGVLRAMRRRHCADLQHVQPKDLSPRLAERAMQSRRAAHQCPPEVTTMHGLPSSLAIALRLTAAIWIFGLSHG